MLKATPAVVYRMPMDSLYDRFRHVLAAVAMLALTMTTACRHGGFEERLEVAPADLPKIEEEVLQEHLYLAEDALKKGNLTTPQGGSAYHHYREAGTLDPSRAEVDEGLRELANHYIEKIEDARRRGDFVDAMQLLRDLEWVYPTHPKVRCPTSEVNGCLRRLLEPMVVHVLQSGLYEKRDGRAERERVARSLRELARRSRQSDFSTFVVYADNYTNEDFRWITEQLATPDDGACVVVQTLRSVVAAGRPQG